MAIKPIPDLDTNRHLGENFTVTLRRRDGEYDVEITATAYGGNPPERLRNWAGESIWEHLTPNQQDTVRSFVSSAEIKVKNLLGL